jgi:hypothetical protein
MCPPPFSRHLLTHRTVFPKTMFIIARSTFRMGSVMAVFKLFKIFLRVFLYCNHQVHRDFLIILYIIGFFISLLRCWYSGQWLGLLVQRAKPTGAVRRPFLTARPYLKVPGWVLWVLYLIISNEFHFSSSPNFRWIKSVLHGFSKKWGWN